VDVSIIGFEHVDQVVQEAQGVRFAVLTHNEQFAASGAHFFNEC